MSVLKFRGPTKTILDRQIFFGRAAAPLPTPYPRPMNYVPGRLNYIIKESSKRFNGLNID